MCSEGPYKVSSREQSLVLEGPHEDTGSRWLEPATWKIAHRHITIRINLHVRSTLNIAVWDAFQAHQA